MGSLVDANMDASEFFLVNVVGIKNSTNFEHHAEFGIGISLIVTSGDIWADNREDCTLCRQATQLGCGAGRCFPGIIENHKTRGWEQREYVFNAQWMPFFRAHYWLSGENIEATAHEKVEWIRRFTEEEIEAWNLNY